MGDFDTNQPASMPAAGPWDEAVDLPEKPEQNKPTIIGSLEQTVENVEETKPFTLPPAPEEKVGQKLPAEQFIKETKSDITPTPAPAPTSPPPQNPEPILTTAKTTPERSNPNPALQVAPSAVRSTAVPPTPPKISVETAPASPAKPAGRQKIDAVYALLKPKNETRPQPKPAVPDLSKVVSGEQTVKPSAPKKNRFQRPLLPFFLALGFFVLLAVLISAAELGLFSIGLEKIYGAVGLEQLWGGLGKNTERSLTLAAAVMQKESDYKVRGEINLTIDKSIKSPLTLPLISFNGSAGDERIAAIFGGARLAVIGDYNLDSSLNQADYPGYQYQGTATKDVAGEVDAVFGQDGSQAEIKIKKVTGEYLITLANQNGKLYLKSDPRLKFDSRAESGKWLEYSLAGLEQKAPQDEIFALNSKAGFSARGKRIGREKVGKINTYHYKIDNLEVGSSLLSLGLSSDMIQGIEGDLWLGIRDKRIYRLDLTVTTSPSAAVSFFKLNLLFYDFGQKNAFSPPESKDIIAVSDATAEQKNDLERKNDLTSIAVALEELKLKNGNFPESKSYLKLNSSDNILSKTLTPLYLEALPRDPKEADGWYYAYKSDGKTFTLSARLEDKSDPAGQISGDMVLYFVKNK